MQLTRYSDYSIRVLMYLATIPESTATISEVARSFRVSRNHLVKVVHHLAQNGYIRTTRGKNGGMTLGRAPDRISIGELVRKTEPDFRIVECFDEASSRCPIQGECDLTSVLRSALDAFLAHLDRYTLSDITENRALLRPILLRTRPSSGQEEDGARSVRILDPKPLDHRTEEWQGQTGGGRKISRSSPASGDPAAP